MLKKFISIILIIMTLFSMTAVFVSCKPKNNSNAPIQLWTYINSYVYDDRSTIISNIKLFCEKNQIPLEIKRYESDEISYSDYILKRNIAVANGNAIILEGISSLHDIAKNHADYTKLNNYNMLFDSYKDKFCVPIGISYWKSIIYNDAISYYGINTDRPVINYDEYLQIKQEMKEKGAKFRLTPKEFKQLIDYVLVKNKLRYINDESEILKNTNAFKQALKNTIIELCDDFKQNNNSVIDAGIIESIDFDYKNINKSDFNIFDENSGLMLSDFESIVGDPVTYYTNYVGESLFDKTVVIEADDINSLSFFMYKKITNDKIYDLANYIVDELTYLALVSKSTWYAPAFDGKKSRRLFYVDENWQHEGKVKIAEDKKTDRDKKIEKFYNSVYENLIVNKEKSKLLADYSFANAEYSERIYNLVADTIIELSNRGFDYENKEAEKNLDKKLDDFVTDFKIHYK